jgi:Ni/Fe-hydrogenase subunit HybB-like protein
MKESTWQRAVPVYEERMVTKSLVGFGVVAAVGIVLATLRMASPLGRYSAMNDFYAWGVWKTFNVMTLTAIGSGALAVGIAAWVFDRKKLHVVMRTALVTSFLFYFTGMLALMVDVGRPWNLWHILLPWHWNMHSALLEVAVCMPTYAFLFLAFENVPLVLERYGYVGSEATKAKIAAWQPFIRRIYPVMIAFAYLLPIMHQSSLGALMLLAGPKVHPLWQSQALPLLYVMAAGICGFAFVIGTLLVTCLRYKRPLGLDILGELGSLMSWLIFAWLGVRFVDIAVRGKFGALAAFDQYTFYFALETLLLLIPALVLRSRSNRETPRTLFIAALSAGVGGCIYRLVPALIAFIPARSANYFPSVAELVMTIGFVAFGIVGFKVAIKYFAILPGTIEEWKYAFKPVRPANTNPQGAPSWQESR